MAQRKSAKRTLPPPASANGADDAASPRDMEEFRWRLIQRINTRLQNWRACPRRPCRRARACQAMYRGCAGEPPLPPRPPEATARMKANLYRALRQRVAEDEARQAQAGEGAARHRAQLK